MLEKWPRRLGWASLILLPVAAALARLMVHPSHYFDGEASIPATIGRELYLHSPTFVFSYQLVPYQGSLVTDSLLSSLGYALFGDHLLAWHWVPLLYIGITAAAGARVLYLACGPLGAAAWPLLLAVQPFLVKDGLISGIGGHAFGPTWALLALVAAAQVTPDRRSHRWALLAGALLAIGTWYVRTTVVAAPAIALACWPGRRRALLLLATGLSLFVGLVVGNAWILNRVSLPFIHRPLGRVIEAVLIPTAGQSEWSLLGELGEVTGVTIRSVFYMQPSLQGSEGAVLPGSGRAGWLWPAAWIGSIPLGVVAWLRARPEQAGEADSLRHAAPIALLAAGWIVAYTFSPLSLEESVLAIARAPDHAAAPLINSTLYIIPVFLVWSLLLALAIGLTGRTRHLRPIGGLLLLGLLAVGGFYVVADQTGDRSDAASFSESDPFFYPGITLPDRLPPLSVHARSLGPEPNSRSYHLEAFTHLLGLHPGEVLQEHGAERAVFDAAVEACGGELSERDLLTLARGMGTKMGRRTHGRDPARRAEIVEAALWTTAALETDHGMEYITGFSRELDPALVGTDPARWLPRLCGLDGLADRPADLCR